MAGGCAEDDEAIESTAQAENIRYMNKRIVSPFERHAAVPFVRQLLLHSTGRRRAEQTNLAFTFARKLLVAAVEETTYPERNLP